MKHTFLALSLIGLSIFTLLGCASETPSASESEKAIEQPANANPKEATEASEMASPESMDTEREPTDDEIREYGLITEIEDSGYPFFSITVEFPERKTKASFILNIESLSQDVAGLEALKNKFVTLYYTSELEKMLLDIYDGAQPISEEDKTEFGDDVKYITGILKGAGTATPGDLPNLISIVDSQGQELEFETFISEELTKKNGKEVTAYYYVRGKSTVTYLRASED